MPLYKKTSIEGITLSPTGEIIFNNPVVINEGFALDSTFITPILTGDVDDYVIPDMHKYSTIVWRSTKDVDVTGIVVSDNTRYWRWDFINGNTNGKSFKFKKFSNKSSVNNQFASKDDITLETQDFWVFRRDIANNKYLIMAKL